LPAPNPRFKQLLAESREAGSFRGVLPAINKAFAASIVVSS
jgi:hypothetical protein